MLQVKVDGGSSITVPPFGGKLSIIYKSKHSGKNKICKIGTGSEDNIYYAYFEEDDVDFQVLMNNSSSTDRSISYAMNVMEKKYGFVVGPGKLGKLETLESNGKKLHFIRQSGKKGKSLVSTTASSRGLSLQDSSLLLSQIKFETSYSKLPQYPIKVKLPGKGEDDYSEDCVRVDQLTTMEQLKLKISKRIGHPPSNFILSWKGRQQDDKWAMERLRIGENSQVDVISVVFPIQIEMDSMTFRTFQMSSWDSIDDLKNKIEEAEGIPAIQQKLVYNEEDLQQNGWSRSSLGRSNVVPNCKIQLIIAKIFPLHVKLVASNKVVTVLVCSRYTLHDVCEELQKIHGIPASEYYEHIYAHGKETGSNFRMLENIGVTDSSCKIFVVDSDVKKVVKARDQKEEEEGPVVKKMKKNVHQCQRGESFTILVKLLNKTKVVSLSVCSSETVEELKEKITEKLGRPVKHLVTTVKQNEIFLLSKNLPIEVYEISERSEIREVDGICVMTVDDKIFPVKYNPRDYIYKIKRLLQEKVGIPPRSQRILFSGQRLDDGRTLQDYNIEEDDILHLYRELVGGGCGGCGDDDCFCTTVTMATVGERGAITFGEKSSQTFSTVQFKEDEQIKIKPFTVELRLAPVPLLD